MDLFYTSFFSFWQQTINGGFPWYLCAGMAHAVDCSPLSLLRASIDGSGLGRASTEWTDGWEEAFDGIAMR